jgi:hypothetical protein
MFGSRSKTFFLAVTCAAVMIPILVLLWNPQLGGALFFLGLLIAARCISLVRSIQIKESLQDEAALVTSHNRGRTIFVQLTDDYGTPLPTEVAQARLAAAQQQAGPRDTVIGVHRKVD